jgi:CRP-like cAMP-binding protein
MGHAMSVQAGFSATMGTSSTMDQSVVGGGMVGGGFGKGVGMGGGGFGGSAGMLSGGFGSAGGGFGDSGVGNGMGQSTMGGGGAGGGVGRIVGQLAEFSGAGTGAGALQMPRSGGFGFGFPAVSGGMVSMGGPGIVPPARPKLAVDIANLSFFAGLEPQVMLELAKVARPFFASAGAVIVSAGIAGAGLYAVEAGKCAAFVSGLQVETIRPGMVFGESNILLGKSQQDVLAIENSAVLEFPYAPLLQIMYGSPGLRAALLMAVHQRSVMTAAASASVGMPSDYPAQDSQPKLDAAPPAGNAAALVAEFSGAMGWPQSRQEGFVRQDTLSNLLGDISSAHDSNPWAKDYAGGVLSDLRDWRTQQLKYNGTPGSNKGSNCSMDSFLHGLGNHDPPDFSRHLVRSRTESRHGTPDPVDRSTLGVHVSRVRESALLLADCSAACLQDIAKLCGSMTAKAGEQLIQTQSIVRYMYLLEAGSVVIIVDGQTIRQLGPGDVFGEIGTLFAEVSTAEAHVLEDSQLLRIAAKDLHSLLSAYPELYMTLKHQCLVNLRRACSGPPPAGLLEAEPAAVARLKKLSQNTNGTHSLADLANRRLVPAGEKIVSVEKDAATLLVLDQGIVHMEREGSVVSALYPGDLIGELGTMISKKHLYDARAATCVEVFTASACT